MEKIILIGDSGHAKVIEDCVLSQGGKVIAKLDDRYTERFRNDLIERGPIELLNELLLDDVKVVVSIGSNSIRKKVVDRLSIAPDKYATVIHRSSIISNSAQIGYGTVIMPGSVINADTTIGNHSIINSSSVVEHECSIADFTHISPSSVLTGNVQVGEGSHIGAGVSIIPGIVIGPWVTIGAGATVITNIEAYTTAVGIPAKVIKRKKAYQ